MKNAPSPSPLFPLTSSLIAAAILWGNIVVRSGAGLACPDWPLCHGRLIPPLRSDVLLEYSHRWIALLLTLAAFASAWIVYRKYPPLYKKLMSFILSLLLLEILLGGLTVLLKLPPPVTITHFAISLLIFISFLTLTFSAYRKREQLSLDNPFPFLLVLFYLQSVSGALVRHTGGGLACGVEFPSCLGSLFPPIHSLPLLFHLLHRLLALLLFLAFSAVCFLLRGTRPKAVLTLFALLLLQIALGAATVFAQMHIVFATLHLANALLLLTLLVSFSLSEENK